MIEERKSDRHILLLIIGFVSIATAITSAYSTPATSYELSIYSQTPMIFWIGIFITFVVSVVVSFISENLRVRALALGLGAFSTITVVLLPLLRSYYYIGEGDALSHLGRALNINAGAVSLFEQLYPLSHTLSIIIYHISGIEVRRSLVLLMGPLVVIFIIFVAMTNRLFSNDKWVVNASIFSSLLLLPVNHFTGHMHPHTTSYAMFFIPLLVFLFIRLMKDFDRRNVILAVVAMFGMILLHPQQAANVILLFSTVASLQLLEVLLRKQQSSSTRQIYPYVVFMTIIFWLWTEGLEKISGNLRRPIANFLARAERETGGNVRASVPSLEAAGGSYEEVFIKLFLLGFVYSLLAAILMTASLSELVRDKLNRLYKYSTQITFSSSSSNLLLIYITAGFMTIIGLFFVYLLADQSRQYFRHHSFMMVIVTVLGSLSLAQLLKMAKKHTSERILTTSVCILFITFLLLSLPVVHVSPYFYQESQHVPESQVKGFETTFEHQQDGTPFSFIRSNPSRYHDAVIGERRPIDYTIAETVPYHFSEEGNLRSYYEEDRYLVVTDRDRTRDRDLHRGIRYTREDYEHFDEGSGINRIQDNGGFTLYRINSSPE